MSDVMDDESEDVVLKYSEQPDESPFLIAVVEEEIRKKVEEKEEEERLRELEAAKFNKTLQLDEKSVTLPWRVYALSLVTFLNVINFTQQYIVVVAIFGMTNELEFGETECRLINKTLARDFIREHNISEDLEELCNKIGRCTENDTLFLPAICSLQYTGQGLQYDILAGPIYMIIQGLLSIPLVGFFQSISLRPSFVISTCTFWWSTATFVTAYVYDYWAIALLRFLFGLFSGPYNPVSFAYLSSIFPTKSHALVFGVSHYGCIVGYGLAFFFVYVCESMGWRWCYFICGATGIVAAIFAFFLPNPKVLRYRGGSRTLRPSWKQQRAGLKQIVWSVVLALILANTTRIASLNVISYHATLYMEEYFPDFDVALLGVVIIVSSFPGSILGAVISDTMRKTSGVRGRLWLGTLLVVIAAVVSPLVFQTSEITAAVLFGVDTAVQDWFFVLILSILSDLTPLESKTIVFAINFFFTYSLAGAINLLVSPLADFIGLRLALSVLVGLLCAVAVLLLLLPLGLMAYLKEKMEFFKKGTSEEDKEEEEGEGDIDDPEETTQLLQPEETSHQNEPGETFHQNDSDETTSLIGPDETTPLFDRGKRTPLTMSYRSLSTASTVRLC